MVTCEGNVHPNQIRIRELRACRPVKFEFGLIGQFDKPAYLLIARLILDNAMNSLLL